MTTTEYALMIDWDTETTEFIPAKDAHHAAQMARTIYAGQRTWTVEREMPDWTFPNGVPICPR
jgi:hypothetical protein